MLLSNIQQKEKEEKKKEDNQLTKSVKDRCVITLQDNDNLFLQYHLVPKSLSRHSMVSSLRLSKT